MKLSPHLIALKKYVGIRNVTNETKVLEIHRCHFRVTEWEKRFVFETAAKLRWSANHFCEVMIEKCLPLVETALFRREDELDSDVVVPIETGVSRCPVIQEHRYTVGEFKENIFVVLTNEAFYMLQYLKETLHFYSYCELFRLIVWFFYNNLDVSDLDMPSRDGEDENGKNRNWKDRKDGELKNKKDGNKNERNENENKDGTAARERLRGTIGIIDKRLAEFRATPILIGTIVPEILRRVRATASCLYPPTQIFLEKMVV